MRPLHYASEKRHLELVKELIEEGADVNLADEHGDTPLHYASKDGDLKIVEKFPK